MMRFIGAILLPSSLLLSVALLMAGGHGNSGYSIAGAILIGSVLISGSMPGSKDGDGK